MKQDLERENLTKFVRRLGYTIDYNFKDKDYSAIVYYPWSKDKIFFKYQQKVLDDFYINMFNELNNNN